MQTLGGADYSVNKLNRLLKDSCSGVTFEFMFMCSVIPDFIELNVIAKQVYCFTVDDVVRFTCALVKDPSQHVSRIKSLVICWLQ